jgi:hypothetical protein
MKRAQQIARGYLSKSPAIYRIEIFRIASLLWRELPICARLRKVFEKSDREGSLNGNSEHRKCSRTGLIRSAVEVAPGWSIETIFVLVPIASSSLRLGTLLQLEI